MRAACGLCAIAITLALAAPALAAPAGDEYLPNVPKAAGKQVVAGQNGAGGTILEPTARGSGKAGDPALQPARSASSPAGDPALQPARSASSPAADTSTNGAGTGALLDPIVLLVIAGVIAATAGMLLRQRRVAEEASGPGAADTSTAETSDRPTPAGGIVSTGDPSGSRPVPDRKDAE